MPDYDRQSALAYARKYWTGVCSDNAVGWMPPDHFKEVPSGTIFVRRPRGDDINEFMVKPDGSETSIDPFIEDCAHFVSCCIGRETAEAGGGLNIPRDFNPIYGALSSQKLFTTLSSRSWISVIGEKLSHGDASAKLSKLKAGDLIFYFDPGPNRYRHAGVYMADSGKRIACHTYCRCDVQSGHEQAWDSARIPDVKYTLCQVTA